MDFLIRRNNTKSVHRHKYVTTIAYFIDGRKLATDFVIDTGAARTIIVMDLLPIPVRRKVMCLPFEKRTVSGVEGMPFQYRKVHLQKFQLAEGLVLSDVVIAVSEYLHEKALLGFDILSLFSLRFDASLNNGLWHIISPYGAEKTLQQLMVRCVNKDISYIDPDFIANIEHTEFAPEDYLRERLGSKINYIAPISRQECKTEEDCLALIRQVNNVLGL